MSKKKTNTTKEKKLNKASQIDSKASRSNLIVFFRGENAFDNILFGLTIAFFIFYLFKLFSSMKNTFFWADENVHAYISSIILKTKSLPAVLPQDIYGGFEYSYPPLFHILSAFVMAFGGVSALKFTNLILLILFFLGFYVSIRKYYGNSEALIACLLVSLSPVVAVNSIRFMTEMLSMFLIFWSFFFLVLTLKKSKIIFAILSGLSTGLLLLSKQIGIVVLGFNFLLLVWLYFYSKKDLKLMLYVIGAAVGLYVPYVIWAIYNGVEVFGFLSTFFGTNPQWAINAVKSFRSHESAIKEFAYLFYNGNGVVVAASFLIPLYHFIRTRARDFPHNYMFILTVYLAGVMVAWHITNQRHTITLLPPITFLCGYAFCQLVTNKIATRATILFLVIIAGVNAYKMPNYRLKHNAPNEVLDIASVIQRDHRSDGRTLVNQGFDFLMYSHKPVIWPYPNLRDIPLNLFKKQPPDELYALLKQYNIDFIIIDTGYVLNSDDFIGRNYPLSFVRNCEILDQQGKISLKAMSDSRRLILLRVI